MAGHPQPLRLTTAFATSAAVHAMVLALLLYKPPSAILDTPSDPHPTLLPVRLVSRAGGGGGGPLPGPPSLPSGLADMPPASPEPRAMADVTPNPAHPPPPLPRVQAKAPPPVPTPTSDAMASLRALAPRAAAPKAAEKAAPSEGPTGVASLGAGPGGTGEGGHGGGGTGTGDGSGGDGSDATARPAYGSNPKPPYPLAARRLGVEGVVTLEVLVRPDGSPAEVRVHTSSGSPILDDSAVETVRSRWRFIPAHRGAEPVESRVTFPIRFRLDAG